MKNIFKLMSVAVLAASMIFVSCKKDDPEGPVDNIPDGISVSFNNGTAWTPNDATTVYYAEEGGIAMTYMGGEQYWPSFWGGFFTEGVGTVNGTFSGDMDQGYAGDVAYCEYFNESGMQDQLGNVYADWWAKTVTFEVKKLDLTALRMSGTIDATMFDAMHVFVEGNDYNTAATAPMTVSMGNVEFTQE